MNKITKKQHYVPQFILKGFCSDSLLEFTNVFDVVRNDLRRNQSIKGVMHQNYFYDADNRIEQHLANSIESPASKAIQEVKEGKRYDFHADNNILLKFLMCQYYRTVGASENVLAYMKAAYDSIAKQLFRLNNMGEFNPDSIKIAPDSSESERSLRSMLALLGVIMSKGMENLKFHVLINKSATDFILGDNPVVRYNWFNKKAFRNPRIGSCFINGVQLIMPISPTITLCIYDPYVYKYGSRKKSYTEINSRDDVDWLNHMQARETESFMVFRRPSDENYVARLAQLYNGKKIYSSESLDLPSRVDEEGKSRTPFITFSQQRKLTWKPTFFKVLKKARKRQGFIEEWDENITYAMGLLLDDFWGAMKSNPDLTNT